MTENSQTVSNVQTDATAEHSHSDRVRATPVLMLAPPRAGLGLPTDFEETCPPQLGSRLQCQADGHIDGGQVYVQGCPDFGQFVSGLAQQLLQGAVRFDERDDLRVVVLGREPVHVSEQGGGDALPAGIGQHADLVDHQDARAQMDGNVVRPGVGRGPDVVSGGIGVEGTYEVMAYVCTEAGWPTQVLMVEGSWWDAHSAWIGDQGIKDGRSYLALMIRAQSPDPISHSSNGRSGPDNLPGLSVKVSVGRATQPGDVPYSQDEFDAAVRAQRRVIHQILAPSGQVGRVGDVLELLVSDLWRSLGRWWDTGRPPGRTRPSLGQWAHGVAKVTAREWLRTENPLRAPQGRRMILLDALPGDALDEDKTAPTDSNEHAAGLLQALRADVLAKPGGAARWERMVRDVGHERRGSTVREELKDLLRALTPREEPQS